MLASPTGVILAEFDIPGAILSEPMASHTMPELNWWLRKPASFSGLATPIAFVCTSKQMSSALVFHGVL